MKLSALEELEARSLSQMFKALGDENRIRIVALLAHGELCVGHLQEALELTQSNTSRQLGILFAAGVVERRRERNWVYFRLASGPDKLCKRQIRALSRSFAKLGTLKKDVERLLKTKGSSPANSGSGA
jgi:ArsR family transcriptional regulator